MYKHNHQTGRVITFSHFSRKSWSLFSCLHREVRIGVLSVATIATAASASATTLTSIEVQGLHRDVEEAADTFALAEANVSTSRAPLAAGLAARQVVSLTRDDLAAAGVTTLNDLLKLTAGVDVRQRGGFGIQTDISIHGGTHDQIAILLNGVPIVNPQTGHNAADFPVNISDIERVEVLEGAASRLMGSQAFSGAINVVTRSAATGPSASLAVSPAEVGFEGGSYATFRGDARTAWQWGGGWYASASGGYQRSDGATANSDFKGGKGYARLGHETDDFSFDLQLGATANDFGANTFYSAAYPDQWEALRRYLIAARAESKGRVNLSGRFSWLRNIDHFQLIRHSATGENFHRTDVINAALNAWTDWRLGRTSVGVELAEDAVYSTNLGRELMEDNYEAIRGEKGRYYTRHDDRTNLSCYAEHNVVWRKVTLSAGVMAARNSVIDSKFRFYPGIDLAYRPAAPWRVYASWNRSLRLPSFTDLWYKSPTQEGNAGLRPEECSAFSVGADYTTALLRLKLKAHYQRGTDMIDWVMRTPDDIYHATSFSLDNYGAGIDATLDFDYCLGTRQPLRRLTVSYAWLHQHRRAGEPYFKSNYAMEYLRHKLVARLNHRIVSRLGAEWTVRVQQREGAWQVYRGGKPTDELRPYGTHALLDCRVAWAAPHYTLYADMTNLTAHRYYDLANVLQPGFMVLGGVRFVL